MIDRIVAVVYVFPLVLLTGCAPPGDPTPTQPMALVAVLEIAAREKDYQVLSEHMVDDFRYSFGRSPSRTDALARYRTHPELLDELANVLDQPCATNKSVSETYFVCPAAAVDEAGGGAEDVEIVDYH